MASAECIDAIQDSMRLGKLMDPSNRYKDALEFGVVAMTEFEKEFFSEIKSLEENILNLCGMPDNIDEINILKMAFQEIKYQLKAIEDKREEG